MTDTAPQTAAGSKVAAKGGTRSPAASFETFSVGMLPEVQAMRRRVSDRIARIAFRRRSRRDLPAYVLWEKIISALDLATDETLKELFYDGGM